MKQNAWTLKPGKITLAELRAAWNAPGHVTLAAEAYPVIEAAAAAVQAIVAKGRRRLRHQHRFRACWPRPASRTRSWNSCSVT